MITYNDRANHRIVQVQTVIEQFHSTCVMNYFDGHGVRVAYSHLTEGRKTVVMNYHGIELIRKWVERDWVVLFTKHPPCLDTM